MKRRHLGSTGISVSEIGVGGWQLGGALTLDGRPNGHPDLGTNFVVDLIRRVGDLGVNYIDTAEQYGDGESERRVGLAVAGCRNSWVISTKFGSFRGPQGERVEDASAKRLPLSLEGSLRRLGSEYIDVYMFHIKPNAGELHETARFLEDAKRKGQIRAIGISTNDVEQAELLLSHGLCDVVQFAENMAEEALALTDFVTRHKIGGVVRGTMAAGRLSGKYFHRPPTFSSDDVRSVWFASSHAHSAFTQYSVLEALVTPTRTMPQLAVRFVLDRPATSTVILGAKSLAEYQDAIRAADLPSLNSEEILFIKRMRSPVSRRLRKVSSALRGLWT